MAFAVSGIAAKAQTTMRIPVKNLRGNHAVVSKNGPGNSVSQLTGGITCNTNYVAGTTMDLSLTISLTNADAEYADFLSITFPAGITPNSSPDATFPTNDAGGGAETLNGVTGQDISWGVDNNDQYGGISTGGPLNFTVNVTVQAGLTGTQTATFFASGDGYGGSPGDLTGSFPILEPQPDDARVFGISLVTNAGISSACNLTNDNLMMGIINAGNNAISSGQPVYYSVNGGTAVSETGMFLDMGGNPIASINSGDSALIMFSTPIDLSAAGDYNIMAWIKYAADANATNDSGATAITNIISSTVAQGAPYFVDIEDVNALNGWYVNDIDGGGTSWSLSTTTPFSGTQCLTLNEPTPVHASEDWFRTSCIDLQAGMDYNFSFVQRMATGASNGGTIGVYISQTNDITTMTTAVIAQDTVTANSKYALNSNIFTVPSTGTYYFGFKGENTDAAKKIALKVDDIKIELLGPTAVKTISKNAAIEVYPNPSNGVFSVNVSEKVNTIAVYNVVGEMVYNNDKNLSTNNTVDLSALNAGIYFVKVYTNSGVTTKQVNIVK